MNKNKFVKIRVIRGEKNNPFNLYNQWQKKLKTESLLYETSQAASLYSVILSSVV